MQFVLGTTAAIPWTGEKCRTAILQTSKISQAGSDIISKTLTQAGTDARTDGETAMQISTEWRVSNSPKRTQH